MYELVMPADMEMPQMCIDVAGVVLFWTDVWLALYWLVPQNLQ